MTIRNATPYNLQEGNYTLYRLWSGDMLLLYVGLTLNPGNRFGQYNRMMSEQPRYNRQHITRRAGRPRMSSEP